LVPGQRDKRKNGKMGKKEKKGPAGYGWKLAKEIRRLGTPENAA
jgi:hypothetical protein